MVTGRRHRTNTVNPRREAAFDGGGKTTLPITGVVDTLEEGEFGGVRRCGGREVLAERLDGDVDVADDLATLERLRSRVVCGVRVGERPGLQLGYL